MSLNLGLGCRKLLLGHGEMLAAGGNDNHLLLK